MTVKGTENDLEAVDSSESTQIIQLTLKEQAIKRLQTELKVDIRYFLCTLFLLYTIIVICTIQTCVLD